MPDWRQSEKKNFYGKKIEWQPDYILEIVCLVEMLMLPIYWNFLAHTVIIALIFWQVGAVRASLYSQCAHTEMSGPPGAHVLRKTPALHHAAFGLRLGFRAGAAHVMLLGVILIFRITGEKSEDGGML